MTQCRTLNTLFWWSICSDIGGPLSPTSASRRDEVREEEEEEEEELELLYDSDLNCFYDPSSGKYYELIS